MGLEAQAEVLAAEVLQTSAIEGLTIDWKEDNDLDDQSDSGNGSAKEEKS